MSLNHSGQNKIILITAETLVLLTSITNLKYKSYMNPNEQGASCNIPDKSCSYFFYLTHENRSSKLLFWIEICKDLRSHASLDQNLEADLWLACLEICCFLEELHSLPKLNPFGILVKISIDQSSEK